MKRNSILEYEKFDIFKSKCQANFAQLKEEERRFAKPTPNFTVTNTEEIAQTESTFDYIWKNGIGNFVLKGPWPELTTNQFVDFLNKGAKSGKIYTCNITGKRRIDLMKIARVFNRTSESCYDKYLDLKNKGLIPDLIST